MEEDDDDDDGDDDVEASDVLDPLYEEAPCLLSDDSMEPRGEKKKLFKQAMG